MMRWTRYLLFAGSLLYLWVGCHFYIETLDDGEVAYCAWRILSGAVPYRDFMLVCMPAHFYVVAFLYKIFGPQLMVERLWQCLVWSGTLVAFYSVGSRVLPGLFCLAGWLLALVLIGRFSHIPGPMATSLFFSGWAVYFYLSGMTRQNRRKIFFSGMLAGFSVLFRQDIGSYTTLSIFTVLAVCHDPQLRKKGDLRRFLAGILCATVAPAVYFLVTVPLKTLFFDLVYYPLKIYAGYVFLPYTALNEISERTIYFYSAPLALISSVLFLTAGWHRPKKDAESALFWPWVLLTILGALFLSQARYRADAAHLVPAYLIATLLFSFLLFCVHQRKKTIYALPALLLAGLFLMPGLRSKIDTLVHERVPVSLASPRAKGIDLAPAGTVQAGEYADYAKTIEYVRSLTSPGEKIFVGSSRHDRICYADPMFYFLSERESATRYHEMYRGVVVTQKIQEEIIEELERDRTRIVVLRKALDDRCGEPNASSQPDGSKLLDDYFQHHYSFSRRFGGNLILVRN